MGDEEAAPYVWTSLEPLMEGQDEAPSGGWVKSAGRCVCLLARLLSCHCAVCWTESFIRDCVLPPSARLTFYSPHPLLNLVPHDPCSTYRSPQIESYISERRHVRGHVQ